MDIVTRMEKDDRKIKIYREQGLLGVFYLQKRINIEFFMGYDRKPFNHFMIFAVYIDGIIDKFNHRNNKNYEEIEFPHQANSFQRIVIGANSYKENMEEIIHYAKLYNLLEIVLDKKEIEIPTFCINGLYIFNIIRLEITFEDLELICSKEEKEYKMSISLGTNIVKLTMRHNIVFISAIKKTLPPESKISVSTKDHLALGYSIYK